jgi:hypothetical protein
MRYWLDTEFIEDGKTIDLISIGIVAEDGREYYAASTDCDLSKAGDWVRENVLFPMGCVESPGRNLVLRPVDPTVWKNRQRIKEDLLLFFAGGVVDPKADQSLNWDEAVKDLEIWAYYADYDWVAFCQLFGTMMDLPKGFPMYCRDIKQECDRLGNPKLPEQSKGEHNALADARWNKEAWEFLRQFRSASSFPPATPQHFGEDHHFL